ncbi:MAG: WD40 repeat protein [Akkermansiaceae bacterium]|jgi:WD40 repeat protein
MKRHFIAALVLVGLVSAQDTPLPVADLQRNTLVDFTKEIVPFLKKNCFACHNEKKAKADLNLESPQAMIVGGDSGPSLVPGKPLESLVFTYSAHLEDDPMPPAKNKTKAVDLNPEELALMKLWIAQGGVGTSAAVLAGPSEWEGLQNVHAIYATAITDDGRFVAAGRGNRIHLYDLHRGALEAELVDPELGTQAAHHDNVHALAFNRDGLLASGGFRSVKLWSRGAYPTRVGKPLPEAPTALAVSPNREWLATGDSKGNLVLHSLGQSAEIKTEAKHAAAIRSLVFSQDSSTLYSISDDRILLRSSVTDPKNWKAIESLPESTSLALFVDGPKLAEGDPDRVIDISASEDGSVHLTGLGGKLLRQFKHGSPITSLIAHAGANRIATAGANGIVRVWDTAKGTKLGELSGDSEFEIRRAAATRQRDVAKRVADLRRKQVEESDKQWTELREHTKKQAEALNAALQAFDAKEASVRKLRKEADMARNDVAQIESATEKSQLSAAQGRSKKATEALQKAEGELTTAERKHTGAKGNRELAVRNGTKAAQRLLGAQAISTEADGHLATAEESVKNHEERAKTIGSGAVRSLAISADGTTLAAGTEKMGVQLWSLTTLQPLDTLQRGRDTTRVVFTPDGDLIAAFADKSLARLAPASWSKKRQIGDGTSAKPFPGRVLALAFHPRGNLLATGSGIPSRRGELKLWNLHNGALQNEITKPHDDTITGLAFSPDGSHLATASTDRLVKLHRLDTGALIHKLEGHTNHVLDVAWSADGQTIASAGADKVTKLWSAETGKQTKSEGGFRKEVTSIEFLGSGNLLLTAAGDKTVKAAGQNLGGIEGFIYTVTASPDGQIIVAGGEDGILRVWRAKDRKLLHSFPPPKKEATETATR